MAWLRLHHGYIGTFLTLWCILTYQGNAIIGEFNLNVWLIGLTSGDPSLHPRSVVPP